MPVVADQEYLVRKLTFVRVSYLAFEGLVNE